MNSLRLSSVVSLAWRLAGLALGLGLAPTSWGAGFIPGNVADRLDRVVAFTPAQRSQVIEILTKENAALQALAPQDRPALGAPIRKSANERIRALLTPDQQKRYDANPTGALDLAVRAYVKDYLLSSPTIAARIGSVSQAALRGTTVQSSDQNSAISGSYVFRVTGSTGLETYTLYWQAASPTAQVDITRIEGRDGAVINP
jgi:hypothetical protein